MRSVPTLVFCRCLSPAVFELLVPREEGTVVPARLRFGWCGWQQAGGVEDDHLLGEPLASKEATVFEVLER